MRILCCCLLLCLLAAPAAAVSITKIGFVDLQRVLTTLPNSGVATVAPRPAAGSTQEIRAALGTLSDEYYALITGELTGSADAGAVDSAVNNLLTLLAPQPTAASTPVVAAGASMDRVLRTVERIGREQGYSLILEKNNLLFGHPGIDITEAVILALQSPDAAN
ncbi:MAG TPA: hypothetical protein PKM88_07690 [bacterium]|nr:hypothetical protein [bacterium]